ncbi:MAG: 4Fe-4S dicluster domain-containing protein [Candidatus Omnitrophota bacterium]|nr:MAG: 4Fe-4S dicluster domain-containing protein [Candidatus Omnitrophota bacterium]
MFSILASSAKSSKQHKTGSWRSLKKPKFLHKNCIACNLCKLICPEGCIEGKEKNKYNSDHLYCKGCGLCAYICPKKDIEMVDENK